MAKYIVNADDFGRNHSVNTAIAECFKHKLINRTTIMVNMPSYDEGCKIAQEQNFFANIGLHLNLDQGRALTSAARNCEFVCDYNGNFLSPFKSTKNRFYLSKSVKNVYREEISAQMDKYIEGGFPLLHIDSHHHVHTSPSILSIVIEEAKKRGFKSMRISRNMSTKRIDHKIVKWFINSKITKNFQSSKYFGNFHEFVRLKNMYDVEIMVHPDIVEDQLVDRFNHTQFESFDNYPYTQIEL